MKIDLIDDTALIETTSIKNVLKKERTILGVRHNASNTNVHEDMIKTQEPIRMITRASNKERSSLLHVCGNVRMNQENGNVGFTEIGNVGFHVDGYGKKKVILGCSLKKQERFRFGEEYENQEKVSTRNCCLNITGNEKGMLGFDKNQEKNGKTVQVWVARGKAQDKYETAFKDDKVSTTEMVEVQSGNGSGKKIAGTTISYSRKQMEDLRFVNTEDQNKNWGAIYCRLGPAVKKEYDGLLDCDYHHHPPPQLDIKKKVTAHGILGPMAANRSWNHWYLCAPKNGLK